MFIIYQKMLSYFQKSFGFLLFLDQNTLHMSAHFPLYRRNSSVQILEECRKPALGSELWRFETQIQPIQVGQQPKCHCQMRGHTKIRDRGWVCKKSELQRVQRRKIQIPIVFSLNIFDNIALLIHSMVVKPLQDKCMAFGPRNC